MAEAMTIARPYANAVFNIASEQGKLKEWSDLLSVLSECISQPEMQAVIDNPSINSQQLIDALSNVSRELMTDEGRQFLNVLADNNRLNALPDVLFIYQQLRQEAEQVLSADVISAMPLSDEQENNIAAALKQRFGRNITLNVSTDENLLGGAIIRAGDLVIDGSALGKLNRLANTIN